MTETLVSSPTREVRIGFDRPFVIIGERINPTGRKILAEEMARGDYSRVEADALAQVEAGAHMLDVNAGIPLADEPAILADAIKLVQSITDVPLSIDSSRKTNRRSCVNYGVVHPTYRATVPRSDRGLRQLPGWSTWM